MNDQVFLLIDLIIAGLVCLVIRLLWKIERNTRKPHFASECCRDEREKP